MLADRLNTWRRLRKGQPRVGSRGRAAGLRALVTVVALLAAGGGGCRGKSRGFPPSPPLEQHRPGGPAPTIWDAGGDVVEAREQVAVIAAAGDIACEGCGQQRTANLLQRLAAGKPLAAILTLGDNAYFEGLLAQYQALYAPAWGRPDILALTRPVPGNHEYAGDLEATGYFDFFNGPGVASGRAGRRGQGYYSYDVGAWHVIALNSSVMCSPVACAPGSPQHDWLLADLAAHPARCTLAYWHHPRFQDGAVHGDTPALKPLWDALYDAGADVVLSGHEHNYQQLAPMDRDGNVDRARGIRSFVVGTGGMSTFYTAFTENHAAAMEVRVADRHGVLELTLQADRYTWRFVDVDGQVPAGASGSDGCH